MKGYKYRIYPTKEQIVLIEKTFGCTRFVYNRALAERIDLYKRDRKSSSYAKQCKSLTSWRHAPETTWLQEVDSTALQAAVRHVDRAYQNFFDGIKSGRKVGFPQFKRKKDTWKSYTSKRVKSNIEVIDGCIKLPKLGLVKCKLSREVKGRILNATVSKNAAGKYFVSLCCDDVLVEQYPSTGKAVGIDLGLHDLAITSDGEKFGNIHALKALEKDLARAQRSLSRKTKGSKNRDKARLKVARIHERIANTRNDYLQKVSTSLVRQYDVICIEDLSSKNMMQNHKLAKDIGDVSWGAFSKMLTYKCEEQHKALVKVDRFFASSQLCHCCGYRNTDVKDLSIRSWVCPECGAHHDRDINASINILNEGLRILGAPA